MKAWSISPIAASMGGLCLVLVLASCWMPPFDKDLSDSERLVGELGDPVFSFSLHMGDDGPSDGFYLPSRDPASYGEGFWIMPLEGETRIRPIMLDPVSGDYRPRSWGYGDWDSFGGNGVYSAAPANPNLLIVLTNKWRGIQRLLRTATGELHPLDSVSLMGVVGGGVVPLSAAMDRYFLAAWDADILSIQSVDLGGTEPLPAPLPAPILPSYPSIPAGTEMDGSIFSASDPNTGDLYLSADFTDGAARTYLWSSGASGDPATLLGFIDKRITGMLADGRLFARSGSSLVVYDPSAARSFRIPMGLLRFVHERRDPVSGEWTSVFTRALQVGSSWEGDSENEYRVEIYEIPSDELESLAP